MASFTFRLESLLKLREADRQQRRLELAEAFQAEQLLHTQFEQVADDLRELAVRSRVSASPGRVNVDRLRDTQRYKTVLESQQQLLRQRAEQIGKEVESRREALAASDKEVRVLEKLRTKQMQEHAAANLRREVLHLDEVAIQQWSQRVRVGG